MIEVNNLTRDSINEELLKKVAGKVLKGEKRKNKDLSIALVRAAAIKKLNREYRKKNQATDVLSFSYGDLGEIVISPEFVKKNVKKFKSTFREELIRVLIHGVLHFLGQDHEKNKIGAKKMAEKESYYSKLWRKIV